MKINNTRKKGKFFAAMLLVAGLTFFPCQKVYIKAEQVGTKDAVDANEQDKMDEKAENRVSEKEDTIVSILGDSISTYVNYTSYKIHQGYYSPSNLDSVNNTWWMRYMNQYGYPLGVHIVLGGEAVAGTVYMAAEGAALFAELAYSGKGEDLETAAVREYGPVPALEAVQTARLAQYVESRAQVEMICVAEYDLGAYVLLEVPMVNSLYRTDRSDRHENGGPDAAVCRFKHSASGRTVRIRGRPGESESHIYYNKSDAKYSKSCVNSCIFARCRVPKAAA